METLSGGYTLELSPGAFPLSTDSMLLSDFVRLPKKARVLDLGSGCATLGLLLCAKDPHCSVTGIELTETAHEAALRNIESNHLSSRLQSICADLRHIPEEILPGSYTCCVSNPPYFSGGEASKTLPLARRDDCCSPADLCCAASKALQFGGDFYLVHRPEKLAQICYEASRFSLEPKRLRLVRHRPDKPFSIILLQCRKGAKPGLVIEEITLFHADGSPTKDYCRIYHL